MTMAWNIDRLRATGDSADATLADMLQLRLEARGDFDLPQPQIEELPSDTTEITPDDSVENTATRPALRLPNNLIVLADSNEPSQIDLLSALPDVEKTPHLNAEIQAILTPLVQAAKVKMPERPTRDDIAKRSRFQQDKLRSEGEIKWKYSERVSDELVSYDFTLKYIPGHDRNKLTGLAAQIGNGRRYIVIGLEIDEATVTNIVLHTRDDKDHREGARRYLGLPELAPDALDSSWDDDILGGRFEYSDSDETVKSYPTHFITLDDNCIVYSSAIYRFGNLVFSQIDRTYNPQKDAFQTTRIHDRQQTFGKDMEPSRVIELVQKIVNAVPVKQLE